MCIRDSTILPFFKEYGSNNSAENIVGSEGKIVNNNNDYNLNENVVVFNGGGRERVR